MNAAWLLDLGPVNERRSHDDSDQKARNSNQTCEAIAEETNGNRPNGVVAKSKWHCQEVFDSFAHSVDTALSKAMELGNNYDDQGYNSMLHA
jgi:hypothetical protein